MPLSRPFVVSVASDHIWPPVIFQPLCKSRLRPELTLTHDIAVGLVVVGCDAGAQPVHFVVAGHSHAGQLAGCLQGKAGLPAGALELAELSVIRIIERNAGEGWC